MGSRTISVQEISSETPHFEKAKQWLADNAIDPNCIPLESDLVVSDEAITYERFAIDDNGKYVIDDSGEGLVRESATVPKHSSPETYGL